MNGPGAHLDENALAAFLAGSLAESARAKLHAHVDTCADCRKLLVAGVRAGTVPGASGTARAELDRGSTLGRYLVLDRLGSGGFGVVYAAYDPDLDRRVAVKLLRDGGDEQARARLLREAQALARVKHPNVVAVHDVGTVNGEVFLAMDLLDGGTLQAWLVEPRPWREVVRAFAAAGRGLAAAHAAGIVHRDFKPANVLLDRAGTPHVTDFGLARPAGRGGAEPPSPGTPLFTTPLTATGTLLGTPAYMAPEQFRGEAGPASDQFSFCVALHEALFGERPFAGDTVGALAREVEEGRVREPGKSAVPPRVRKAIRRGLAANPADRHPGMTALVEELLREPLATPRRAAALAAGGLVIAGLAYAVARPAPCRGSADGFARVWDAGRRASAAAAFAASGRPFSAEALAAVDQGLASYGADWAAMRTEACQAARVRKDQSETVMTLRMECLDRRLREVDALAGLFASADANVVDRAVAAVEGLPALSTCADVRALSAPIAPPLDPGERARGDSLRGRIAEARALLDAGRYPAGLEAARALAAEAEALHWRPAEAEGLLLRGELEEKSGSSRAAEESLRLAALAAEAGRHDRVSAEASLQRLFIAARQAHLADGEARAQEAAAALERAGDDPRLRARYDAFLGILAERAGRYDEALAKLRSALAAQERLAGPDSLAVASALNNLGSASSGAGKFQDAVAAFTRSAAIRERRLGKDHPDVAIALTGLASAHSALGDFPAALAAGRRAYAIAQRGLRPDHPGLAAISLHLGNLLADAGSDAEAIPYLERGVAILEQSAGPEDPQLAVALLSLGRVLDAAARRGEALAALDRALRIQEKALGPEHVEVGRTLSARADVLSALGRPAEALEGSRRALAIAEKSFGKDDRHVAFPLSSMGAALVALHRPAEALPHLERAVALLSAAEGDPSQAAEGRLILARALWDCAQRPRARREARSAREAFVQAGLDAKRAEADAWLSSHR